VNVENVVTASLVVEILVAMTTAVENVVENVEMTDVVGVKISVEMTDHEMIAMVVVVMTDVVTTAVIAVVMTIAKEVAHVVVETQRLLQLVAIAQLVVHTYNFQLLHLQVVGARENLALKTSAPEDNCLEIKKTRDIPESFLIS
jgi:hypothetical protein